MDSPRLTGLVGRSLEGDPEAFGELVTLLTPGLRQYCKTFFSSWHDAEDATQDAWIRAWQSLGSLRDRSVFKTWLFRLARNICLDRIRQRANDQQSVDDRVLEQTPVPDRELPENLALQRGEVDDAWAIINGLPSALRQTFVLIALQGMSYKEAALVTNVSESTVRGRLARARNAISEAVS
ncbi:RNA polymerase sigma factor [Glutamicibacter sp. JL.03c]|uniref:RNA polymerase sigma factor n=1 Tax=Glutamicibacter sp. JL.03c TaxID=2984842 RepID=UPI0021F7E715|nr:RNA polymerase sigma factor [Glutamicibacter sp. JL.03c]UYQ77405.1 RNA polymerase sigma factor [Glutamicibacter sp. JL.03c]